MIIGHDWLVLDTNVWIFGLREQSEQPACQQLLRQLPRLYVKVPRQVLRELRANLTEEEMRRLFCLLNQYPDRATVHWDKVEISVIRKYQQLGCKLGDAAVAAHMETLEVGTLVSENRDFLYEIQGLPFRVLRAEDVVRELGEIE
jgi:predicted nucleic acid-binding protein